MEKPPPNNIPLSNREITIVKLILRELTGEQIAEKLGISVRTVEQHRRHIYQKTKTRSGIGLLRYALKKGLVRR